MSSVQTSQLISLLINNVLMVITATVVALVAWLRWRWLQTVISKQSWAARRRCRWAYVSFLLTVVGQLGLLASLGALTLRAIVNFNVLVMGAMGFFLVGILALLVALGLWFRDVCVNGATISSGRCQPPFVAKSYAVALLPGSVAASASPRRRRSRRSRQPLKNPGKPSSL